MISSMHSGGSERQTLMLLRHLDRARFEPHLYLTHREGSLLEHVPGDVQVHSFSDIPNKGRLYYPGQALRQQSRFVANLIGRHQIDVVYDRTFHMTLIAGPAARRTDCPRVSTIVSPPDRALPLVESRFVALKRIRLARAYQQASRVIAVSRQAALAAQSYYRLATDRVEVIANGVDIEAVQDASRASSIDRDDRFTLVCVGRMTREKGHRDLIEAMVRLDHRAREGHLPPLRLWLVGDGPLRSELQQRWQQRDRLSQIDFVGPQSNAPAWIDAADALVLPSHFEGMPNVVLEAMALRTPVIATRVGGTTELEREEPTILWATPGDPKSLAEAIEQQLNDPDAGVQRAGNAAAMIQQHHDIIGVTRQLERVLRDGACARGSRRP